MDALNWHLVGFQLFVQSATPDRYFTALYSGRGERRCRALNGLDRTQA